MLLKTDELVKYNREKMSTLHGTITSNNVCLICIVCIGMNRPTRHCTHNHNSNCSRDRSLVIVCRGGGWGGLQDGSPGGGGGGGGKGSFTPTKIDLKLYP